MIIERVSEACSILEECLSTDGRSWIGVRVDCALAAIKALQSLASEKRICECVYLSTQLRLLIDLWLLETARQINSAVVL